MQPNSVILAADVPVPLFGFNFLIVSLRKWLTKNAWRNFLFIVCFLLLFCLFVFIVYTNCRYIIYFRYLCQGIPITQIKAVWWAVNTLWGYAANNFNLHGVYFAVDSILSMSSNSLLSLPIHMYVNHESKRVHSEIAVRKSLRYCVYAVPLTEKHWNSIFTSHPLFRKR